MGEGRRGATEKIANERRTPIHVAEEREHAAEIVGVAGSPRSRRIRLRGENQEPLSTPVPMPPSILSSEALVIWLFRIAMNETIMAAITATAGGDAGAVCAAYGLDAGGARVGQRG